MQIESAAAVAAADEIACPRRCRRAVHRPPRPQPRPRCPRRHDRPGLRRGTRDGAGRRQRRGKACGLLVNDGAAAAQRLEQGWAFVAIGSDSTLLAAASRSALRARPRHRRDAAEPHHNSASGPSSRTIISSTRKRNRHGWTHHRQGHHRAGRRPDQRRLDGQAAQPRLPGHSAGLPGAGPPAPAGACRGHRPRPGRLRPGRPRLRAGAAPTTARSSPTPTSTSSRSAHRTCCTGRSASPLPRPASRSGSRSRSVATPSTPADVAAAARSGRCRDLHRLQLPARPRSGAHPRADRERRARPDHQRPRGLLQRLRLRAQRAHCRGGSRRTSPAAARSVTCSATSSTSMQYVVGPITDVSGLLSTITPQRPILPMGSGTHFAVIEDGELGDVENDDYAAALVRFAADSPAAGAVGTLEASRVIVGPQCGTRLRDLRHRGLGALELRADERAQAGPGPQRAQPGLHHHPRQRLPGRLRHFPAGSGQQHGLRRPQGHRGEEVPRRRHRGRAAQLHHRRRPRGRRGHRRRRRVGGRRAVAAGPAVPGATFGHHAGSPVVSNA